MLKYLHEYESLSAANMRTFKCILGMHLVLLKMLLVLSTEGGRPFDTLNTGHSH